MYQTSTTTCDLRRTIAQLDSEFAGGLTRAQSASAEVDAVWASDEIYVVEEKRNFGSLGDLL
jgi:hypothetical protein